MNDYCRRNKKIKLENSNDKHTVKKDFVSNVSTDDQDISDEVSVISDVSQPEHGKTQSTSMSSINYGVLGILLNTLFTIPEPEKWKLRDKSAKIHYNTSSLKIHPNLAYEVVTSAVDDIRYRYIVNVVHSMTRCIDNRDFVGIKSAVEDIFCEDCTLMTAALCKPRVGRDHVKEMLFSIMRSCLRTTLGIYTYNRAIVNGCTVLTFHHRSECKHNNLRIYFSVFNWKIVIPTLFYMYIYIYIYIKLYSRSK
jgi:hypothetical protein